MDFKSANRIACFINDTENGSVYLHLKDLTQTLTFKTLEKEHDKKFHPVIELRYTGLKIQAFTHLIVDFGQKPIFGTIPNPLPAVDYSQNVVDQFEVISTHAFREKYSFHFASSAAVKLVNLVVGLEEIRLRFDGMQLRKEDIANENQVELSQLLYRAFAIHNPEVNCVSMGELTHFAEKNISIVPNLKDGAWTIYATNNSEISTRVVDHYALWDGFDGQPVYFNAQISKYSRQAFSEILSKSGWETQPATHELLCTFEIREVGGDVYTKSTIDQFIC